MAESFGGLEIDNEIELARHWNFAWFRPAQGRAEQARQGAELIRPRSVTTTY